MPIIQRVPVCGCGDAAPDGLPAQGIRERIEHIQSRNLLVRTRVRGEQSDSVVQAGDIFAAVGVSVDIFGRDIVQYERMQPGRLESQYARRIGVNSRLDECVTQAQDLHQGHWHGKQHRGEDKKQARLARTRGRGRTRDGLDRQQQHHRESSREGV